MITQDEYGRFEITSDQDKAYGVVESFLQEVTGSVEKVECRIRYKLPLQGQFTYVNWETKSSISEMETHLASELSGLYNQSSDYIAVIWIIVHKEEK